MERKTITLPPPTQDQMDYLAMILRASEYDGSYVVGGPKKPDHGRVPDRESFWLVERKVSPPLYVGTGAGWTADPLRAHRFDTERQAHDHWRTMTIFRDESQVIEHLFINRQ